MNTNKNPLFLILVVIGLVVLAGVMIYFSDRNPEKVPDDLIGGSIQNIVGETKSENEKTMTQATIVTSEGEIQIELYDGDAPKAVANFVKLAREGFYDNLIFHRVIKDFMIQGGDPNCTDGRGNGGPCGSGGPGYEFADELNPTSPSYKNGYKKGVVAMANHGPNTNGSQFFIMLRDTPLSHDYTIFGKVISGQEIVDKIGVSKTDSGDKPTKDAVIQNIRIEN